MGRQLPGCAIAKVLFVLVWLISIRPLPAQQTSTPAPVEKPARGESKSPASPIETVSLRGRVVWLAEALETRGARSVPEARERTLALQTGSDELIPILEDVRGRALRLDERLRAMELELLVRKLPRSPVVQIIAWYEVTPEGKFELDYWCQVCAIAMFELKACDCCQGETEFRKRRVAETKPKLP